MSEFEQVYILTSGGTRFSFVGKFRRDLEKKNWHYYELENGGIIDFRKEHMVFCGRSSSDDAVAIL